MRRSGACRENTLQVVTADGKSTLHFIARSEEMAARANCVKPGGSGVSRGA